jgi:hypothetical protein
MDFAIPITLLLYMHYHTLSKAAYFLRCCVTSIPGFYVRSTGVVAILQIHITYNNTFKKSTASTGMVSVSI